MIEKRHPILPPFYLLAGLLLIVALDRLWPLSRMVYPPAAFVGIVPMLAGLLLIFAGVRAFRRADTPVRPFEPSTTLVSRGPFRWSRNPMYLGMMLALAGAALLSGSLSPWVVPPLFVAVIRECFIKPEERLMTETFGDEYRAYCRRVRRWL